MKIFEDKESNLFAVSLVETSKSETEQSQN